MANDLATLTTKLSTKLRDSGNAVWASTELNDILTWACAQLYPRLARSVRESVTLVNDTDQYALTTVASVSRVDMVDPSTTPVDELVMILSPGTWEWWPTAENAAGGTLFINRGYGDANYHLRVHGYAPYDLSTNYPIDAYVPALLGMAAAEAIRRMMTDRAKFKQWQVYAQEQNISLNEFIGMVNEGDAEAQRLFLGRRTWRKPLPAVK